MEAGGFANQNGTTLVNQFQNTSGKPNGCILLPLPQQTNLNLNWFRKVRLQAFHSHLWQNGMYK